jgi:hypothetical protein
MQKNVDGRVKPDHDGWPPSVISRAGVRVLSADKPFLDQERAGLLRRWGGKMPSFFGYML